MKYLIWDYEADVKNVYMPFAILCRIRASYKNESWKQFGYFSKIANLPQFFCLCLIFFFCFVSQGSSWVSANLSTASSQAFLKFKTKFKLGGKSAIKMYNRKVLVTHSYNRLYTVPWCNWLLIFCDKIHYIFQPKPFSIIECVHT